MLSEQRLLWRREFAAGMPPGQVGWCFAGWIGGGKIAAVRFGDQGQYWQTMPVAEFQGHGSAVPYLQDRLPTLAADRVAAQPSLCGAATMAAAI